MRKMKRKTVTAILCGVMAAGVATGAYMAFGDRGAASSTVSAGLQQLADQAYLASAAVVGESITFTPEWFDTTLCGGTVKAITVTALPPVTEGQLLLGSSGVTLGQIIPREMLSYLTFSPAEGMSESSFDFVPTTLSGNSGYSLTCHLSQTQALNCCPTGSKTLTAVSTHSSLTYSGTLHAKDPEGEQLCFEILSYPESGVLTLNAATGDFSYLPSQGFQGTDRFTWRAQDPRGGFSETATVEIAVYERPTDYVFTDIGSDNLQSAALRVTGKRLMSGEVMGGKHYFHPDRTLTRAAFVTILLEAAEIKAPEAQETGFADDTDIPAPMKGAIRYAKEQGWLEGDTFRPNDPITRAEAAQIAAKILKLSAPGYHETVEDFSAIPVDVADAVYAIYEGGYITTLADGTLAPMGELTRGDAAKFFAKILDGKGD
ncbi:MAG: S-layer homology domain-containing protein [Clostridia bacterium]|nr:S-layer homology domain-containing protein [Clostridia bacterium]